MDYPNNNMRKVAMFFAKINGIVKNSLRKRLRDVKKTKETDNYLNGNIVTRQLLSNAIFHQFVLMQYERNQKSEDIISSAAYIQEPCCRARHT
jgi:hypothetical protein